jgi:ribosomal-protein-alanine N-acetyltransferase
LHIVLETKRLIIRQFTLGDAAALCELDSDPEVMRYINGGLPPDYDHIRNDALPRQISAYAIHNHYGFWAAEGKDHRQFIGWFHFRPDKETLSEIDIGYRLKRSCWGCGYATEGARALVAQGFGAWGEDRVGGYALAANAASRRVLEKAGLTLEKEFAYGQDVLPGWSLERRWGVKYALDKSDYVASTKK